MDTMDFSHDLTWVSSESTITSEDVSNSGSDKPASKLNTRESTCLTFQSESTNLTIQRESTNMTGVSTASSSESSKDETKYSYFVIIFNKVSGSPVVNYLMVDTSPKRPPRLMAKLNTCLMSKVKDITGYRVIAHQNRVYVLGGRHLQSRVVLGVCYMYDPEAHSWTRLSSMLRARTRFSVSILRGCLYVCGGEGREGKITDSVECYNPYLDEWTDVAPMPTPRADHSSCVSAEGLFVSGGTSDKRGGSTVFWHYDPQLDKWTEASRARLPAMRHGHLMTSYKDDIFVLGGHTIVREKKHYHEVDARECWCFRQSSCTVSAHVMGPWQKDLPDIPCPRAHAGHIILGHYIYFIGGTNKTDGAPVQQVQYFNAKRLIWVDAFSISEPLPDVDCVVVKVPHTNLHFSHLGLAMHDKWIMW